MSVPEEKSKPYLVIAEHDLAIHEKFKSVLKESGFNPIITSVFNGEQLIHLLLKQGYYKTDNFRKPDVVVLNLNAQVIDGLSALEKIRTESTVGNIPVYLIVDVEPEEIKRKAASLGATGFINKHSSQKELRESFSQILKTIKPGEL